MEHSKHRNITSLKQNNGQNYYNPQTTAAQRLSIFDRQYPVSRAKAPVAPIVLQNLPKVDVNDHETTSSHHPVSKECTICNEAVKTTAIRLPCSHVYHSVCITQWLKDHDTCPLCRFSLPTLCHFTTPRSKLPPPPMNATLRPPVYHRSRLQYHTITQLQEMYRSWVICTYHHQQLPINLPQEVSNDRDALISYLVENCVIQIFPDGASPSVEQ
jgi:Ring finger domain